MHSAILHISVHTMFSLFIHLLHVDMNRLLSHHSRAALTAILSPKAEVIIKLPFLSSKCKCICMHTSKGKVGKRRYCR